MEVADSRNLQSSQILKLNLKHDVLVDSQKGVVVDVHKSHLKNTYERKIEPVSKRDLSSNLHEIEVRDASQNVIGQIGNSAPSQHDVEAFAGNGNEVVIDETDEDEDEESSCDDDDGMSAEDILSKLKLQQYTKIFKSEELDFESDIKSLNDQDLSGLGLKKGHRVRMLKFLSRVGDFNLGKSIKKIFNKKKFKGLVKYIPQFSAEGYDYECDIQDLDEAEMSRLGMKLGHRKRFRNRYLTKRNSPPRASEETTPNQNSLRSRRHINEFTPAQRIPFQAGSATPLNKSDTEHIDEKTADFLPPRSSVRHFSTPEGGPQIPSSQVESNWHEPREERRQGDMRHMDLAHDSYHNYHGYRYDSPQLGYSSYSNDIHYPGESFQRNGPGRNYLSLFEDPVYPEHMYDDDDYPRGDLTLKDEDSLGPQAGEVEFSDTFTAYGARPKIAKYYGDPRVAKNRKAAGLFFSDTSVTWSQTRKLNLQRQITPVPIKIPLHQKNLWWESPTITLNMFAPYSSRLVNGQKTIETRNYALPKECKGIRIGIVEIMPRGLPSKKPELIGEVIFVDCKEYVSRDQWERDAPFHQVALDDQRFGWRKSKKKFGWVVHTCQTYNKSIRQAASPHCNNRVHYTRNFFVWAYV